MICTGQAEFITDVQSTLVTETVISSLSKHTAGSSMKHEMF